MKAEGSSEIINNKMKEENQATAVKRKLDSTDFEIEAPMKKAISATTKNQDLKENKEI